MDVRFITTTLDKLDTVPIVDGQVIALSDIPAYYYDMGGERKPVTGQTYVTELPVRGIPNIVYVVTQNPNKGMHIWNGSAFVCVSMVLDGVTITYDSVENKVTFS